jgi:alpha-glucosidase
MFFNKYPHRANFSFTPAFGPGELPVGSRKVQGEIAAYEGGIFHLSAENKEIWSGNLSLCDLNPPAPVSAAALPTELQPKFGLMGEASIWTFTLDPDAQFFGMGAKNFGEFELSGQRTRFWNTDVWSDFPAEQWGGSPTDPPYFSTPYIAAHSGGTWYGFLLHNPYPAFMETPGMDESRVFVEWQRTGNDLVLGTDGGEPHLWIIVGDSLADITKKLQKLVGTTPVPPIWSLGYHQSRWGYGGHDDLMKLDEEFTKHQIPCDGLWMDLDYMDGYRIFTVSETMFPEGALATAVKLADSGRRVVPIIDPGVKSEAGYNVYDDGIQQGVFAKNTEGNPYIGLVWPGETVFPDFSLAGVRDWWSGYAAKFRSQGFGGCWVDMNDPSTGPVDPHGMLFADGTLPHAAHRNQYGLGMQMATQAGFLRQAANERPFILSRSGYTGSSRYAAIWSGDNISNYFYLGLSIPTALGMSISGLPFNGADMAGFGGDVTDGLMLDWTKAAFLSPFLRNHCNRGQRNQEPFAFPPAVMTIVRRYIRLRYKMLPYLYNLFAYQETDGAPIMRPLLYEFDDEKLAKIKDQFMIGHAVLQAPFVTEVGKSRIAILPGEEPWYDAATGEWRTPGEVSVRRNLDSTPLWVRAGAILPMQPGTPTDNSIDLRRVDFHMFVPPNWTGSTTYRYVADDGISFDYQRGVRSALHLEMAVLDGHVAIITRLEDTGFGDIEPRFIFHGAPQSVRLNSAAPNLVDDHTVMTGKRLRVKRTD